MINIKVIRCLRVPVYYWQINYFCDLLHLEALSFNYELNSIWTSNFQIEHKLKPAPITLNQIEFGRFMIKLGWLTIFQTVIDQFIIILTELRYSNWTVRFNHPYHILGLGLRAVAEAIYGRVKGANTHTPVKFFKIISSCV